MAVLFLAVASAVNSVLLVRMTNKAYEKAVEDNPTYGYILRL